MGSNIHQLNDYTSTPGDANMGLWQNRFSRERSSGEFLVSRTSLPETRCIDLFFPGFTWKSVLLYISFVQIIIFIVTLFIGSTQLEPTGETLAKFGSSYGPSIQSGQVWRLVTPLFLHASIWHILFNVYFQLRMGFPLERTYGLGTITAFYFATGIGGNLLSVATAPCTPSIGASTAGFGLIGLQIAEMAIAWHFMSNKDQALFNIVTFVVISILFAASPMSHVDWRGHLGGFIAGFSLGIVLSKNETPPRWLKPTGVYSASAAILLLYVVSTLVIFLIPMGGIHGRCTT